MGGRCDLGNTGKLQAKGPTGAEFVKNADEGVVVEPLRKSLAGTSAAPPGGFAISEGTCASADGYPSIESAFLVNFRQLDPLSHFFRQFQSA